ncbi:zf-TFIIB domain-containing protein [Xenorhabdus bovienii]|nr:zf-TFIIB domain-containing protein [Xenorhabdus bovienii]MDE9480020.1 hypothetical protein [Xenorhabdus bovienii]
MTDELKPCPKCGSNVQVIDFGDRIITRCAQCLINQVAHIKRNQRANNGG